MKQQSIRFFKIFLFACSVLQLMLIFSIVAKAQEQTAPATQSGPQEELIPEEARLQQWTKAFQDAETAFNSANQETSIPLLQSLCSQMLDERNKRQFSDPEQALLLKSLDMLGQALYLNGQQDEAQAEFVKLIEIDPNYRMNEELVSPKIVDLYNQIKSQNLGAVSITSVPPGATVKLDGKKVGETDMSAMYSPKGDHELEITKPGYFPQKQTITIAPGKNQKLNFQLARSSSVAYFITYPKGVEVVLGGKTLGESGGQAGERGQQLATAQNLQVNDISAEFAVSDLQPGDYQIEFRKPCWETPPRKITITENKDYLYEPVVLVPSQAYLNISANDPQANIFIDNEYKGLAPKDKLQVCSGPHTVKLKGPLGKYETKVESKKDDTLTINATLNPSLAFLGILGTLEEDYNVEVIHQLSGLRSLNFQDNVSVVRQSSMEEPMRQILAGLRSARPDPGRKSKIGEICNKAESDLLLLGTISREKPGWIDLYLLSTWSSMPDVRHLQANDAAAWQKIKDELDYEQLIFAKRTGLSLIDTSVLPGPVVAEVAVKTFPDGQPINPGDTITAINDKPVKSSREVEAILQTLKSTDQATVSVQRGVATTSIPLKLLNSPAEIPLENPDILFNRQLAVFNKALSLSTNPLEKNVAMLNIGLSYLHFGEYQNALDQFQKVQLDRGLGIGAGTVKFHISQCYREMGSMQEAKQSLAEALRYDQNRIDWDDGRPLKLEAERAEKALQ